MRNRFVASCAAVSVARPKLCAIVPTFQALATLPEVLNGVARWRIPIIVVDDGSTDATRAWLETWRDEAPEDRALILRAVNGGKAAALRDAFAHARERGFDGAVTIDADGQHDPADGARLIERFVQSFGNGAPNEASIVCGVRDASTPGYPLRNLTGRRLNDLAIRAQTGVAVSDCPCGLRVYPRHAITRVRCVSGRFAWEEEFLTRALWMGARYEPVAIRCIYAPHGERRSHYRFRRDWPEGIAINLWLILLALRPPAPTWRGVRRVIQQVKSAFSLARAREQIVGDSPARLHGAAVMAIGAIGFGYWQGPASTALVALSAIAIWIIIRLHGAMLLAIGAGAVAWSCTWLVVQPAASAAGRDSLQTSDAMWVTAVASVMPVIVALALLLMPSVMALRRRAA